jgi:hypothetical protein
MSRAVLSCTWRDTCRYVAVLPLQLAVLNSCRADPLNTATKLNSSNTSSWLIRLLISLHSFRYVSHLKHRNYSCLPTSLPPPPFALTSSDLMREVTQAIHSNLVADYYISRSRIAFSNIWAFMAMETHVLVHVVMTLCRMAHTARSTSSFYRSQWPRGLRRRSAAERLLGSRVRIPPGAWMFLSLVQCLCCQVEVSMTGRSLVQRSPTSCGVCLSVIEWK